MLRRLAVALIVAPFAVIALVALAGLAVSAGGRVPAGPGHAGTFQWRSAAPGFGGFSAIEVAPDGLSLTALSDRGAWITARITRRDGRITGIAADPVRPLLDHEGRPVVEEFADSEGLAIAPDGTAYISFELYSRVLRFPDFTRKSNRMPHHPDFLRYGINSSLESLAVDAEGALYTLPEEPLDEATAFPVYRFRNDILDQPFSLPRRGRYLVTGADILDGRLYILERAFYGIGFSSRVRRFDMGDTLTGEAVLMQSRLGQFDNLEGISVWRDGADTVLTMISDNNFLPIQRTEIVEYRIPD